MIGVVLVFTLIYAVAMLNGSGQIYLHFTDFREQIIEIPLVIFGFVYVVSLLPGLRKWIRYKKESSLS